MEISLLLTKILATVFPLITIVSLGFLYARKVQTNMDMANKLNVDVFTPALIFSVLSDNSFDLFAFQYLAVGALVVVLGSGLLLLPVCRWLGVAPKTFLPPMMFSNSGNLGLPLVVLAFGENALPAAMILFIVENGLHFTVGLYILDHKTNPFAILKMPMIIATILGLLVSALSITIPMTIITPIDLLGQIAIPLMLFSLGVRMNQVNFSDWKIGLWGGLLAPLSGLIVALFIQYFLQLPDEQYRYLLLFGALPPAVLNYIVAERYQQDPQKVASIVLMGNMLALVNIPLVLFFIL